MNSRQTPSFTPVILSGGSGTRLWPLSRASLPKQLHALAGRFSLLQATLHRADVLAGTGAPLIVAGHGHRFAIVEQLEELGIEGARIMLEPAGRNTAPAIALAALHLFEQDHDALMLIMPADHIIGDGDAFGVSVDEALKAAKMGYLVTFGVTPGSPETGYGYIKAGAAIDAVLAPNARVVEQFVEKPGEAEARRYLAHGGYTWNSGMLVCQARVLLEELDRQRPDILSAVRMARQTQKNDLGFLRPGEDALLSCPAASIDVAVLQGTRRAAMLPARFTWRDVGSWTALWDLADKDSSGNANIGDCVLHASTNNYIRSEHRLVLALGVRDLIVVETADAVLIMQRNHAENLKPAVAALEREGRPECLQHARKSRPWGWYEGIDSGEGFLVKRIMVKPGHRLSLQRHRHRAEHWVVVSGTARVTLDGEESYLEKNQSTYIPLGKAHRLENPGTVALHLIEVQSGAYLDEDDIVRLEDAYGRTSAVSGISHGAAGSVGALDGET